MMTNIKKLSTSILFLFIGLMFSQKENVELYDLKDDWPHNALTEKDTFKFPHEIEMSITIHELKDLTFKSNYFYTSLDRQIYSRYDTIYTTNNNKIIDITPYVNPFGKQNEDETEWEWYMSNEIIDEDSTVLYEHPGFYKNLIYHKWDLKNYPFDTQKLKIEFQSVRDTSLAVIKSSEKYKSVLLDKSSIIDGWYFEGITSEVNYREEPTFTKIETNKGQRNVVTSVISFYINLKRDGLFLYFKLFFGTFLSFIISYLVFFIDKKYFETRITLSIGGIFGAVGNRYFVESIMPEVQILTKGDLINNLIIFLIVVNIFIVILQNRKIKNKFIADNRYPAIFSIITFILLNLIIIFM